MHMALGDHIGTLKIPNILYSESGNFGAVDLQKKYSSNTVLPSMTIDSLMLPCPKLIKIDVEGMELGVLKGGHKTIKKSIPLDMHYFGTYSRITIHATSLETRTIFFH